MSRRFILGVFDEEHNLLGAAKEARQAGLVVVDAYMPYPVHGLDQALGWTPSRLTAVCLAGGVAGLLLGVWLQFWTSAVDWPINVGGRPWNSWPAFVPVIFELMVLLAGFGVVFAFLAISRLYPGKVALSPFPGVTHDRFVLVMDQRATDGELIRGIFESHHAVEIVEREESELVASPRPVRFQRWNVVLAVLLVISLALNWLTTNDTRYRGTEFLPNMVHSPAYSSFSKNPHLPAGVTLQPPVPGTIARGKKPFHFKGTPEEAIRAGKELSSPVPQEDSQVISRGKQLYESYCLMCHGAGGSGDGQLAARGIPTLSLTTDKTKAMKDGQMFHVLTHGQGQNMASYAAQLSEHERWLVIGYIRNLQKQEEKNSP